MNKDDLKRLFIEADKEGFKKGKLGLNGLLFKKMLISPTDYNKNRNLKEEDFFKENEIVLKELLK